MIHSFLLIGQSNMAGRGFIKDVALISDPHIKMLRNGRWQIMSEPINYDRAFAGIGPAASFAQAWRNDHPDEEIGLIPCADGGSSLEEWQPDGALFDHAVMQAKLAQRISRIDGILWHQGETDCADERITVYAEKLERTFAALRDQLTLQDVPILIGGLGEFLPKCRIHDYFVNAPQLTRILSQYADKHENCWFVTAKGLAPNPDNLHFNAASQRIFGFRYYEAFRKHCSLLKPMDGEDAILASQQEYATSTLEEKAAQLKQALDSGTMTRQEYDMKVDALISSL